MSQYDQINFSGIKMTKVSNIRDQIDFLPKKITGNY